MRILYLVLLFKCNRKIGNLSAQHTYMHHLILLHTASSDLKNKMYKGKNKLYFCSDVFISYLYTDHNMSNVIESNHKICPGLYFLNKFSVLTKRLLIQWRHNCFSYGCWRNDRKSMVKYSSKHFLWSFLVTGILFLCYIIGISPL